MDGAIVDAYYFCVGGAVGRHQAVARPIGLRLPADAELRGLLAGELVEAVARDTAAERPPHGVDG